MTTEFIIEYIRLYWWLPLFCVIAFYTFYTLIKLHLKRKKIKDKKKGLQKKLAGLEAEYGEKAKKLEENMEMLKAKLKEKDKFLRRG